ncbi:MAG: glycerol-3-phosphate transporter permease, partial [Pseudomonadota bacterium]
MAERRTRFSGTLLPLLLVAPQLIITVLFFIWPAAQALEQGFYIEDAFGFARNWVGLANYQALFEDPRYLASFLRTLVFGVAVTALSMGIALVLALAANRVLKAALAYRTLLIWPYAVAPALAGVIWFFLLNPSVGIYAQWLEAAGVEWNHFVDGNQALTLVIVASVWKQISYNFLFFLA